jgi:hypothetical protein
MKESILIDPVKIDSRLFKAASKINEPQDIRFAN